MVLLAVVAVLVLAPAAYAQSSAQDNYGGQGPNVQAQVSHGVKGQAAGASAAKAPSGLPFTGLDLGLILGGGLVLVASGAGLARLVSRRAEA